MPYSQTLLDLSAELRTLGRCVVSYTPWWPDKAANLANLTHLGDTEGDVTVTPNRAFSTLTLPEITGEAVHERRSRNGAPVISMPLYAVPKSIQAVLGPEGQEHMGYTRDCPVTEYTISIIPEDAYFIDKATGFGTLAYTTAGGWTVGGVAMTAAQQVFFDRGMWFWRCSFDGHDIAFAYADVGKSITPVSATVMWDGDALIPDGQHLYTMGDPVTAGVDIEPVP